MSKDRFFDNMRSFVKSAGEITLTLLAAPPADINRDIAIWESARFVFREHRAVLDSRPVANEAELIARDLARESQWERVKGHMRLNIQTNGRLERIPSEVIKEIIEGKS